MNDLIINYENIAEKINEAQKIAEEKIYQELKLGELIKSSKLRLSNITKQQASQYKLMASYPEIVESAITKSRENNDIVSRPLVLDMIRQHKRAEKEAKREAARQENSEKIKTLSSPLEAQGLFQTIVIDPAWDFYEMGDKDVFGRIKPDYKVMSFEEIKSLPIAKIADENCHLYLWVTNRSLSKGFNLLEAWKFRYITCLKWVKPNFGVGNYFRGQTEHVLFGVKGSQPLKRHDVGTFFTAPRGEKRHSAKPDEFYSLVESCSYAPYIDIFGRKERQGWAVWGENS